MVVTDRLRSEAAGRPLATTVTAAVHGGATTVLFREKDLSADERRALGEAVAEAATGAQLAVASDAQLAEHLGATAVHLASADPWPATELAVGRSCHDAVELSDAAVHGATYATLSPVFSTTSKPGYGPPLALDGLADLATRSPIPVIALGGVEPGNAADCLAAGARGVAVMGGVMGARDPRAVVLDLLDALDEGAAP
jgi:thiamine-phosphate pyrophosphorylase